MRDSARLLLGLCGLLGCAAACKRAQPQAVPALASAAPAPLPLDHLAPDELAPGKVEVYGFPVPRGMEVESHLTDRAYVSGRVLPEVLANYVREQVIVSHVEIGAAKTVFPMARIKAGPADRLFTLEVLPDGPRTRLVIKDTTPPPPPVPGMTDAERWRAAGLTPDGRPLDPQKLE
ncbi:MAG TPA: hypothetical protein VNG33_23630 [Polyangiaceae bacterium]|nr:hypothetical protein [Polyangiaceae bacterium]